jgi:aspartate ammonia-lyase
MENFDISKRPISVYPELVVALAMVKQAAARANRDIGVLDEERADLIDRAAQLVIDGDYHEQFVVGVVQGGAGTSTNMNANEVITNIALGLADRERGDYAFLSPIDHTNRSQSTNDVYPTAVKIGLSIAHRAGLEELDLLRRSFLEKAREFHDVLKVGRTQLQDAVPMTLGQEFHGFATTLGEDLQRLRENASLLTEVNMGATAIGTGVTAHPDYAEAVRAHLATISGLPLKTAGDLVEATSDTGAFMSFSGSLKRNAMKLSKICNDLRLLSSGPQAGFGEINLPARQAGSSIMPGKVNPVIPEVVNQVAFSVAGADLTVTMAAEGCARCA